MRQSGISIRGFYGDERGMVTHFALVVMILVILFSGLSLDSTNAWRTKFMLQTAADATAHAAIIELQDAGNANVDNNGKNSIRNLVLPLANANLTSDSKNSAITWSDIEFGVWDTSARTFTETNSNVDAVRVVARRSSAASNALPTMLLRVAGLQSWNIEVESVAYLMTEDCGVADISTNGFFSVTSNNDFYNAYCVEAALGIDLNNGNEFDDDNVLFVTDFSDIGFPSSASMSSIVGRGTSTSSAGLTYGDIFQTKPDISAPYVADVETLGDNYLNPYWDAQPAYVNTASAVIQIAAKDVKYTAFAPGRIYEVTCGGSDGTKGQFFNNAYVTEVVIVSECKLQLGRNSVFEDVILVSRDTGNKSIYAASGVQLGMDDSCADGGGVRIYTAGSVSSAANLSVYGAFISAAGDVNVASGSNGVEGLTIYANGDVSFSSQATFGVCKDPSVSSGDVAYLLVQ